MVQVGSRAAQAVEQSLRAFAGIARVHQACTLGGRGILIPRLGARRVVLAGLGVSLPARLLAMPRLFLYDTVCTNFNLTRMRPSQYSVVRVARGWRVLAFGQESRFSSLRRP